MTGRRAFLGIALRLLGLGVAGPVGAKPNPPAVLFICEFSTAKSAIARELFRKRARERGIAATAFSRGLQIEDHISSPLKEKLAVEGIDSRRDGFVVLTANDVRSADLVVTFATLPAEYRSRKLLDWTALPSVNDAWPAARADLDRRIDGLLDLIIASGMGQQ